MKEKLKSIFKSRVVWAGIGSAVGIAFPKLQPFITVLGTVFTGA